MQVATNDSLELFRHLNACRGPNSFKDAVRPCTDPWLSQTSTFCKNYWSGNLLLVFVTNSLAESRPKLNIHRSVFKTCQAPMMELSTKIVNGFMLIEIFLKFRRNRFQGSADRSYESSNTFNTVHYVHSQIIYRSADAQVFHRPWTCNFSRNRTPSQVFPCHFLLIFSE